MSDAPIFIGGLQRSGTSLMRGIIGSHPEVAVYPSDLHLWTNFYPRYKNRSFKDHRHLNKLLDDICNDERVIRCYIALDLDNFRQAVKSEPEPTLASVFDHFLRVYAQALGRPRWGLKTPHNEFFANEIFSAFKTAKMIHMVRDPRDVAVSFKSYQGGAWKWRYNILTHIYEWKRSVRLAEKNMRRFPNAYIAIRYEDMVSQPVSTVQQICKQLKLSYQPEMLEMREHPGWSGNNSYFTDIGRISSRISSSAVGRYQYRLQQVHIWLYQRFLKRELQRWHYTPMKVHLGPIEVGKIILQPAIFLYSLAKTMIATRVAIVLRRTPVHGALKRIFVNLHR